MVKKLRFSILSLLMLICGAVMAQEVTPYKSLTFPDDNKQSNGTNVYTSNWTAKIGTDSWTISKFSNNNWAWDNIRCGRKNTASVATIVNDAAFEKAVTKVVVDFKSMSTTNKNKVNSIKLIVASDDNFSKDVQTITGDLSTLTTEAADMEFEVSSPSENLFYKLEVNCQKASNGFVQINSLKYYASEGGSGTVSAPKFSAASTTFTDPFQVTLTAEEGADIYYTTNGDDPTTSSTKYTAPIDITTTTTLKAIAVINGVLSDVTTATYTYQDPSANDGSFAKPYTAEEVLANSELSGKTVWVKGVVLGQGDSQGDGYKASAPTGTNIAIGESGLDKCIVIALKNGSTERTYCNKHAKDLMGKEMMFYGTVGRYFSRAGFAQSGVVAFAGTEESPIATLNVKTQEGYATFVSELPFYVPEGVECATITEANENGALNFNYKYKAGYEASNIVPADYPVLVKADGQSSFNLAIASGKGSSAGTNLLKAGTDSEIAAEVGHYYYKLAYDNFDTKEGLGFYWGATNGGAFTVPTGSAYLDIESTGTTALKSFRFDNATTGISTPVVNEQGEAVKVAYTLDGRRVDAAHLTKGLYIVNGKKVIVK